MMKLNDEIINLRDKLNKSIDKNECYEYIYSLSVELDQLIALYYEMKHQIRESKFKA